MGGRRKLDATCNELHDQARIEWAGEEEGPTVKRRGNDGWPAGPSVDVWVLGRAVGCLPFARRKDRATRGGACRKRRALHSTPSTRSPLENRATKSSLCRHY